MNDRFEAEDVMVPIEFGINLATKSQPLESYPTVEIKMFHYKKIIL